MDYLMSKYDQIGYVKITLFFIIFFSILLCFVFLKGRRSVIILTMSKWTHSVIGNFILAGIGILWASLVSVFGTQLQQQWFGNVELGNETLIFFISVTIALIMSFLHYIQSQHNELQNRHRPSFEVLMENSKQSIHLMTVVSQCINFLQSIYAKENTSKGSVLGNKIKREKYNETLDNAIENNIKSILIITKKIIEGYDDVNLKANIFNLIPSGDVRRDFNNSKKSSDSIFNDEAVNNSPFFLFSSNLQSRLECCDYVLVCEKTRTCQLDNKGKFSNCMDGETPPLCMPFSKTQNKHKHPNLFGAPSAISNRREVYIENIELYANNYIKELKSSTKYKDDVTVAYEKGVLSYYEKDIDKPKSIISFPIYSVPVEKNNFATHEGKRGNIMCVLNIYANRVNFLENQNKAESLYELLKPILYKLGFLMTLKNIYTHEIKCYNTDREKIKEVLWIRIHSGRIQHP